MEKKKKLFIIGLVLISIFFVLLPRISHFWLSEEPNSFFYSYPLHTDEWQHYTVSLSLKDKFFQPKVFYYQNQERIVDGSPLFHELIFISQKLGVSPDKFFILPVLQGIFFILIFFFFLSLISNPLVGFIASLFVLCVRSDIRILGLLFFKPFVLGFAFFILALFFLHKKRKFSFAFLLSSLFAVFCYPPLIILLLIYLVVYQLTNKKIDKKYLIWSGVLILLTLIFGFFITKGDFSLLIDKIFYQDSIIGWGGVNLIKYFGSVLIVFGLIGLIKTLKKRELWPWHALFFFFVLNFILTLITKCSFGFHYMRIIYLGGIIFSFYAAQGVILIFNWLKKRIKQKAIWLLLLLLIITLILPFNFYAFSHSSANPAVHANWLNKDNFNALMFLNNLPDKSKKLLHSPRIGTVITPLTGFKVTALQTALTGGKRNEHYEIITSGFDCEEIKKIIEEKNYNLLWLKKQVECEFLKSVFENKSVFIYEYQDF